MMRQQLLIQLKNSLQHSQEPKENLEKWMIVFDRLSDTQLQQLVTLFREKPAAIPQICDIILDKAKYLRGDEISLDALMTQQIQLLGDFSQ